MSPSGSDKIPRAGWWDRVIEERDVNSFHYKWLYRGSEYRENEAGTRIVEGFPTITEVKVYVRKVEGHPVS